MTSFINNNKNEQPRESLHMIMLIIFILIPIKFRLSTFSDNSLFAIARVHITSLMRITYELTISFKWIHTCNLLSSQFNQLQYGFMCLFLASRITPFIQ